MKEVITMRKSSSVVEWSIIAAIFLISVGCFFFLTQRINGPFIFADEAEYHWLASEIFHYQKFYGHQYNPLYPLLIAPTFYFESFSSQFYAIKLINLVLYASIIFPIYLIGREILPSQRMAILVAFAAMLGPVGAYSHLVWADPLYYMLIGWSYYFIVRHLIYGKAKDIFLAGILIGLAYLAKQAAIFLLVAWCGTYAYAIVMEGKTVNCKSVGLIILGVALVILPWILRNIFFGSSAIGYSSMFSLFLSEFSRAPFHILSEFARGIGYSVGYWFFVYFGGGFVLLLLTAFNGYKNKNGVKGASAVATTARIVLLHTFFLMIFSELFLVAYGKTSSANGRYVDVIYPIAIIVIAWAVLNAKKYSWRVICGVALACFGLLVLFSPLTQVEAYGVVNNSGVSILNFVWADHMIWARLNPTWLEKTLLALTVAGLTVGIMAFRKKSIWVVMVCGLALGIGAHAQVGRLGHSVNWVNQTFLELERLHISPGSVVVDEAQKQSSIVFHERFWFPTQTTSFEFVDPMYILGRAMIDFGVQGGGTPGGLKIWAPQNPESVYSQHTGIGFKDVASLSSATCEAKGGLGDFVINQKQSAFVMNLPRGHYRLTGKAANVKCLGEQLHFIASIPGQSEVEVSRATDFTLSFDVAPNDQGLVLNLLPSGGAVWALDQITIERESTEQPQWTRAQQYLLSSRLLPLPQVYSSPGYRLYKIGAN